MLPKYRRKTCKRSDAGGGVSTDRRGGYQCTATAASGMSGSAAAKTGASGSAVREVRCEINSKTTSMD